MTTLLLLAAVAYLIWGLVQLVRAGFVRMFNESWAEAFNDPGLSAMTIMALVMLMMSTLIWCWLTWPMTLAGFRRDQANQRDEPWGA